MLPPITMDQYAYSHLPIPLGTSDKIWILNYRYAYATKLYCNILYM